MKDGAIEVSEILKTGTVAEIGILTRGVVGDSICGEVKRRMVVYLPGGEGRDYIFGVSFVQISDYEREIIR